jgi:plastocyanin
MFIDWSKKATILGLSVSATLAAVLAGCGGTATEHGDAVVLPDPKASVAPRATMPGPAGAGAAAAPTGGAPAASATPVTASGWGTLKGQIKFAGNPPEVKVLQEKGKAVKDPDMCAVDSPILSERFEVDSATKGVKNVLVYLPRPTAVNEDAKKAVSSETVMFDQKHCVFEPHVLGLMTGVPVTLKSSDSKNHNVNVKLKSSSFNQTIGGGQSVKFTPLGPERMPGQVVCDIHPWMMAWWMVLDHPYSAVTDAKGNFEIKNAPAGTQKVVVWQEAVGFVTPSSGQDVTIKPSDTTVEDFTIDPAKTPLKGM